MAARPFFQPGPVRDQVYANVRDHPKGRALRDWFEELWRRYAPVCGDNPDHFLSDARDHFHARAWEMYLACALMDHGCVLERPPPEGPDHLVRFGKQRLWIEDTITELGTGPAAVEELQFDGEMHVVERDPRMLRYSSAIRAKWNQWLEFQCRGIVEANEPYLVAVNGGLLSWADVDHGVPDMVRTVLGLGEAQYIWNRDPSVPNEVHYPRRPEVRKESGSPVRMEFFATPTCNAISGLFFSAR